MAQSTYHCHFGILPLAEHLVGALVLTGAEVLHKPHGTQHKVVVQPTSRHSNHAAKFRFYPQCTSSKQFLQRSTNACTLLAYTTHLCAFNAQHPVDAVGPAAIPATPGWWAVAHHDVVLILLLAFAVTEEVLTDQLHNSWKLGQVCWLLIKLRRRGQLSR